MTISRNSSRSSSSRSALLFAREELRVEDEAGWLWRELYFEQ